MTAATLNTTSAFTSVRSGLRRAGTVGTLALGAWFTTPAGALEINTTLLKANAELQMSVEAFGTASAAGVTFSSLGNTFNGPGQVVDGDFAPSFYLPITSAEVSVGWDLKLKPRAGEAIGSALLVQRGANQLGLANFEIDYGRAQVLADVFMNGANTQMAVFTFVAQSDLDIGLQGLSLNLHQTLGNLRFTQQATDSFASALRLSAPLKAALQGMDFGTITIDITTALRKPVSDHPFAVTVVSEPASVASMMLGLAGIAGLSWRRRGISR